MASEASQEAEMAVPIHLTPEECGRLAALARPAVLALTHLYPPVEEVDVAGVVAMKYSGPVIIAHDGLQLGVGD